MIVFLEIQPRFPVEAAPIRLCSASDRRAQSWDDKSWAAAIMDPGELGLTLFNGEIGSDLNIGSTVIRLAELPVMEIFPDAMSVRWVDASYKLWVGRFTAPVGGAYPYANTISLISSGRVERFEREANSLRLNLDPTDGADAKSVLTLEYAGTGGAEGSFDMRGKLKPWLLGYAKNVEPVLIDTDNNVYQFSAYGPIDEVTTLYERGSSFGDPIGDYPDYPDLVAATIPAGRWATCAAYGMVRLGAPQFGAITGDVRGHKISGSVPRRPGSILRTIATALSIPFDTGSMNALDNFAAALPDGGYMNLYLSDDVQFLDLARRICNGCNAQAGFNLLGEFIAPRIVIGDPEFVVDDRGRQLPLVRAFVEADAPAPYKKIVVSADKSWRVHDLGSDIAFNAALRPAGFYRNDETYREGDVVELGDKSTWLYTATTPSAGNAPPTYPETDNDWWALMTPPVDVSELRYGDGTPLEELRPAEPGATAGATQDQLDAISDAISSAKARGQLFFRSTAPSFTESQPGDTWIDDNGVFYDRVEVASELRLGGSIVTLDGKGIRLLYSSPWVLASVQPLVGTITSTTAAYEAAQLAYQHADTAVDGLIGLADDGRITPHEKITALIPLQARLEAKWTTLVAIAATLSVNVDALDLARDEWLEFLDELDPPWNNISADTPVVRDEFNYFRDSYDEALFNLNAEIQAEQRELGLAAIDSADAAADLALDVRAIADGMVNSYFQDSPPSTADIGDLWFDTNDGDKQYRWNGTQWVVATDTAIGSALVAAAGAQATADGKVTTFFGSTAPTAEGLGDLWYQTTTGYLKRWDGTAWVNISSINNAKGSYAPAITYNPGDMVLWEVADGGTGDGYTRTNSGPTTGVAPSNATYWTRFVAAGASTNVIWRKSATMPATPASSAGTPSGWYDSSGSLPTGSDPIWVSYGIKSGNHYLWQAPVLAAAADTRLWDAIDQDGKIKADAVGGGAIQDGAVDTPNIANNAVNLPISAVSSSVTIPGGGTTLYTLFESSWFDVGVGSYLASVAIFFFTRINSSVGDSAANILIQVDKGSGYETITSQRAGIRTDGGDTTYYLPIALCAMIDGVNEFRVKIVCQSTPAPGRSDYRSTTITAGDVVIQGIKR